MLTAWNGWGVSIDGGEAAVLVVWETSGELFMALTTIPGANKRHASVTSDSRGTASHESVHYVRDPKGWVGLEVVRDGR